MSLLTAPENYDDMRMYILNKKKKNKRQNTSGTKMPNIKTLLWKQQTNKLNMAVNILTFKQL